jgi:hypothetical protein
MYYHRTGQWFGKCSCAFISDDNLRAWTDLRKRRRRSRVYRLTWRLAEAKSGACLHVLLSAICNGPGGTHHIDTSRALYWVGAALVCAGVDETWDATRGRRTFRPNSAYTVPPRPSYLLVDDGGTASLGQEEPECEGELGRVVERDYAKMFDGRSCREVGSLHQ